MTVSERRRTVGAEGTAPLSISVIVPFHANLHQLSRCLSSLLPLPPRTELIVAADRAPRECERIAGGTAPASLASPGLAVLQRRGIRPHLKAAVTC